MSIKRLFIAILALFFLCRLQAQERINGKVIDASGGQPLVGATVVTNNGIWAITDTSGVFSLKLNSPLTQDTKITISLMGYKTLKAILSKGATYRLSADVLSINEVVITATESHGQTSSTRIGEDAISHIQPSSFADILELLPGGRAHDPVLSTPQIVDLRSAGTKSNYTTSSLGTRFLVDGKPINNDANLQFTPAYSNLGSNYVNLGTDMREISTEDIESVDVVRGIASVEYGDLTSGLIKINRKKGGKQTRARFKADMKSKLFYLGKGMEWGQTDKLTMNVSANFLDSRSDPRNNRQNWKRLTGSFRMGKTWTGDKYIKLLNGSLDYTGSFDNQKSDVDLDVNYGDGPIETYKSTYNKISLGTDFTIKPKEKQFFKSFTTMASLSYEKDLIDRWKHVSLGAETPISTSTEPGEYDAVIVPVSYDATLQVDGRPFYVFANAVARFNKGIHNINVGVEWNMDKNYGEGSIYDTSLPFSTSMSTRPRPYSYIPATHQFSAFVEENGTLPIGNFKLDWTLGLRSEAMGGAGKEYDINLKPYLDPRANLRLEMPKFVLGGYKVDYGIYGGIGWHTKFPTMDMLFPYPIYGDLAQFNYWPVEKELRKINLYVYKIDPTNYNLSVARNLKWEIGFDASWNGFTFSIDYFREDMTSGFNESYKYTNVIYKDYDESVIDKSTLTGPPSLENIPYQSDTLLTAYTYTTNGSRTLKQGIEFSMITKRIKAINTRISINGAWFRTEYMNSIPEYYRPSVSIGGESYPYIGLYQKNTGTLYETFNTNFMFDTQVPRLGLIFSTSFQALWFTGSQSMPNDPYPISYIDKNLTVREFTSDMEDDAILGLLVRDYTSSLYVYQKVPFSMNINLKVSKQLYHEKASIALFVNKILDVTPNYYRNDVLVRRNVLPYFGMELDFRL